MWKNVNEVRHYATNDFTWIKKLSSLALMQ